MDAGAGSVEGQFAYRNTHAVHAQVAQAQDALTIGHHDDAHLTVGPVVQNFPDAATVLGSDKKPPGAAEDVSVFLTGFAHRGRIDDGHHLLDVFQDQACKKGFVAILQGHQKDIFFKVRLLAADIAQYARQLGFLGMDPGRQQPSQPQNFAFFFGKGRPLVQNGIPEQVHSFRESGKIEFRFRHGRSPH